MYNNLLRNKSLVFGTVATTLAAGGSLYAYENYARRYPRNLNSALDYYGFKDPEQKKALRFLMQKAGIKDDDALLDRRAENQAALSRSILGLVSETQDKFTIRTGKQERWDVQTSDWMKDAAQQKQIISALEILNMMDAVPPALKKRDVICVLGASRSVMVSRLEYAGELFTEGKLPAHWLIMLAGERYVTPDKNGVRVDGSEEELSTLATKIGKNVATLTETDLMKDAYESSKLYGKFPDHDVLIDTPRRNLPRPTTETTVTELCDWLKQHPEVQDITFVSNQPHVDYQKAIIAQVFEKQGVKVKFEVVGPAYRADLVSNDADKINYVMQALGSRIWAATPEVMDAIGLDMSDPELRAEFKKLYEKQPLIYSNFEAKQPKPKM
jgi:cellobiose-specific phosphotransferase system component IIB